MMAIMNIKNINKWFPNKRENMVISYDGGSFIMSSNTGNLLQWFSSVYHKEVNSKLYSGMPISENFFVSTRKTRECIFINNCDDYGVLYQLSDDLHENMISNNFEYRLLIHRDINKTKDDSDINYVSIEACEEALSLIKLMA